MPIRYPELDRRDRISPRAFYEEYVETGRPVVLTGALQAWPALQKWSPDYFRRIAGNKVIRVKDGYVASKQTSEMKLGVYIDLLEARAKEEVLVGPPPPYLHDLPLLTMLPEVRQDLEPFPRDLFPKFYRRRWWDFTQFFLGPRHSLTPLHFDCLLTQNLFFQVSGRKRWILIPREDAKHCAVYDWRWSDVDPETPNYAKFPDLKNARCQETTLGPGEIIYVPPGTLHHVRGLDVSISFNIDWHTPKSAVAGVLAAKDGMPLTNVRYNLALAAGLCSGLPMEAVMPFYRSYLTYIS